jgi:hypothetical protein
MHYSYTCMHATSTIHHRVLVPVLYYIILYNGCPGRYCGSPGTVGTAAVPVLWVLQMGTADVFEYCTVPVGTAGYCGYCTG